MNNLKLGGIEMKKFNIEEMENYEVNEIKDDLVCLKVSLKVVDMAMS